MATGRTPLMAGNWKMNLNHLEAIALVQKIAFALQRGRLRRPSRSRCSRRSPTSAPCRPWSTATSSTIVLRRAGPLRARLRCLHRRDLRRDAGQARLHLRRSSGTASAAQYHGEDDALVNAKVKAALRHGLVADRLRRRGAGGPRGGQPGAATRSAQLDGGARGHPGRAGGDDRRSPTSPCGRSAPARSRPPRTPRRSAGRSAPGWPSCTPPRSPPGSGSSTAARSRPRTSPAIMAKADVDGALVGGASLDADEFASIARYKSHATA